jgi:hypothetical protein
MKAGSERVLRLISERIRCNQNTKIESESWPFSPLQLPRQKKESVIDHARKAWALGEMLECYDRQFVHNAYIVLLKREPDITGVTSRLEALQQGAMTRTEILFRLRYGAEGRIHKVRVRGLVLAVVIEKLCAIPVLGIIPRTLQALAYLPRLQRDIQDIRSLQAMDKIDSDDRLDSVLEFQNVEFDKLARILNKKK